MGYGSKVTGGIMSTTIIPSNYAPHGVPPQASLGNMGEVSIDLLKDSIMSFIKAGGSAAASTALQNPEIKAMVTQYGIETAKLAEAGAMKVAFDKFYTFYDQHRIPIYAGLGVAALGSMYLVFFRKKRKAK